MKYALTYTKDDPYIGAMASLDTVIVECDCDERDFPIELALKKVGLTQREIEDIVLEDNWLIRPADLIDINLNEENNYA